MTQQEAREGTKKLLAAGWTKIVSHGFNGRVAKLWFDGRTQVYFRLEDALAVHAARAGR